MERHDDVHSEEATVPHRFARRSWLALDLSDGLRTSEQQQGQRENGQLVHRRLPFNKISVNSIDCKSDDFCVPLVVLDQFLGYGIRAATSLACTSRQGTLISNGETSL